jgi:hypothetical protein
MRKTILFGSLACLALTACQTLGYETTAHHVAMPDDVYRVFEHPKKDRIMTAPSLGAIVAINPGSINSARNDLQDHRAAARKYLDETGRAKCPIISGREVAGPQFQFLFNCPES